MNKTEILIISILVIFDVIQLLYTHFKIEALKERYDYKQAEKVWNIQNKLYCLFVFLITLTMIHY